VADRDGLARLSSIGAGLLAPALAAGYGAYLLQAALSGALYFYIHPIYIVPTVLTGLVLLALALASLLGDGDNHHAHEPPGPLTVIALALLLALGFLLPAQPLSAVSAERRGVELGGRTASVEAAPEPALGTKPERYTIKDWVKAFQADPEPSRHAGKLARVTGFVHRNDRLPADWFMVARFVVKCCAVDAQPVGLPVHSAGHPVPEPGGWVSVEGAWEVAEVGGERRAVLRAARITPTPRPEQPYLY
jgi:putative membrane protein